MLPGREGFQKDNASRQFMFCIIAFWFCVQCSILYLMTYILLYFDFDETKLLVNKPHASRRQVL